MDAPLDENYSKLSEAIMTAISKSKEVQQVMTSFRDRGWITNESYFNFILSLEELSTLLDVAPTDDMKCQLKPAEETPEPAKPQDDHQDGQGLTENEVRFEEYYRKVFNEEEWLKKTRLKLQ